MTKKRPASFFLLIALSCAVISFFNGCKNDIDLNADYKDALVCYGILNPYDSVQYVRIEKIFLGTSNAFVSAQQFDSTEFQPGRLSVMMEQWNNGQLLNTYPMTPDTSVARDSGLFSYPYQVLYKGIFPVLKDGSSYKVVVTDLVKGTTINAVTNIPQDVSMVYPSNTSTLLNLYDSTVINIRFNTGRYGYRYHMFLRFHYTEQFRYDTTQQSQKYVDWNFGEEDAVTNEGNHELSIAFIRHRFLDHLASTIPEDPLVRRISGKVDFYITGATEELATYMDLMIASNNSVSPVPYYTNVNGGYGLFAARTTQYFLNYSLDLNTRIQLHLDPVMLPLDFAR